MTTGVDTVTVGDGAGAGGASVGVFDGTGEAEGGAAVGFTDAVGDGAGAGALASVSPFLITAATS